MINYPTQENPEEIISKNGNKYYFWVNQDEPTIGISNGLRIDIDLNMDADNVAALVRNVIDEVNKNVT